MAAFDRRHIAFALFGGEIVSHNLRVYLFSFGVNFVKITGMKAKDINKFKVPADAEERDALMVVLEMRGDRVLVSDLRFSKWAVPPTDVYAVSDLELAGISAEKVSFV